MEILEKNGIIKGYTTVIDKTKVPLGVQFILDVETIPELYQDVVEVLATDRFMRQVYSTTGDCRLHAIGFASNMNTLESHVNHLFRNTKGIRKLSWHLLLKAIKDEDGGVEYERKEPSSF